MIGSSDLLGGGRSPKAHLTAWACCLATLLLCLAPGARAQEPKQPFVNKIIFEGNDYFSTENLKDQMKTKETGFFSIFFKPRLDPEVLRRDIASLTAYYHANGFIDAIVELKEVRQLEDPAFVDVVITVVENEALRVESIRFYGETSIDTEKLSKTLVLRPGVPFNPTTLESDLYAIKREFFERGYLSVIVRDSVKVDDSKQVRISFHMDAGPVIRIDRISVTGNEETKMSIIRKEFAFESGDVFRLSKILETQRNLLETGLLTVADIEPVNLNTRTRTVDIAVRLRERDSAYVEAGFGVGSVNGSRVLGEWGERNVFGTGRLLRFKIEYAFALFEEGLSTQFRDLDPRIRYYRYDLEFGQRRVFGTKVNLGINAFYEKDATVSNLTIYTNGLTIGGNRRYGRYTQLLGGFTVERIRRQAPGVPEEKSNSHILGSLITHDRRDFILDPKQGSFRSLRLQLGGGPFGGDNDFYTITPTYQKYVRALGSTVAFRARFGFADAYGRSDNVPVENRYFTGGSNSVRGHAENSLGPAEITGVDDEGPQGTRVGGRVLILGNAEWRFPLPRLSQYNFSGAIFADAGNVWATPQDITLSDFKVYVPRDEVDVNDFRYSVGLGIRYNTPVGPIRVDYGIPIKREPWLRFARWHISLGQIF